MRSALGLVLTFLLLTPARSAELVPASTYAVIVGVLKWEGGRLTPFSPRHRKDQELYDLLRARGVPAENLVLLLDDQATRAGVHKALAGLAAKAGKDATFLFYYAGHGSLLADGSVALCNYDFATDDPRKPPLRATDVSDLLRQHYRGERVLLLADCCHSGGLAAAARALGKAGCKAASLTSADAANLSSGNWTFTQAILDALRGDPLLDRDGDGVVTLAEAARAVELAMKHRERQMFGYTDRGFGGDFRLSRTGGTRAPEVRGPFALRDFVLAPDGARLRPARVVGGGADGQVTVEFYDYTDKRNVDLPADRLKKMTFRTYRAGQEVQALWQGKLWPAKILQVKDDFHLIAYPGWPEYWNEWVLADRIVAGPVIEVLWEGKWYPATVLEQKGDRSLIHYLGYDESWDEWVTKDRVRTPAKPK
jgi:hypothetical protein